MRLVMKVKEGESAMFRVPGGHVMIRGKGTVDFCIDESAESPPLYAKKTADGVEVLLPPAGAMYVTNERLEPEPCTFHLAACRRCYKKRVIVHTEWNGYGGALQTQRCEHCGRSWAGYMGAKKLEPNGMLVVWNVRVEP